MALWLFISPRPKLVTTRGFCTPLPPRMLFAASWLILFLLLECALPRAVGVCVCASATFLNVIIQATSSPAKTQCSRKRTETCMSDAMLKRFPYFLFELLQVSLNFTQGDIWIGRYPFTIRLVKGLMMDGLCARVSHLPIGVEEFRARHRQCVKSNRRFRWTSTALALLYTVNSNDGTNSKWNTAIYKFAFSFLLEQAQRKTSFMGHTVR